MAVLNPHHLFDQADKLLISSSRRSPRQVDLRRAISTAYYGVFHYTLAAAADEFVGSTKRKTDTYTLVYRSVDHRTLRDLCNEIKKKRLTGKYQRYEPVSGFGSDIQAFAGFLVELQQTRHSADYDPSIRVTVADARVAIATARSAIRRFRAADEHRRKAFCALVLFPPR